MTSTEWHPLTLSCGSFTLLLASYYVLRPVRDGLAATLGADSIKYLSTAVFFVMLGLVPIFGWLVTRVPRPWLVPGVYLFFLFNLAVFAVAFGRYADVPAGSQWARAFYGWVTVFNMFALSVFWSRMAEMWNEPQGRRFFGVISAGGSLGGLIGPLLARILAGNIAISGLVWVSAALLCGALCGLIALSRQANTADSLADGHAAATEPMGGHLLEGLCLIVRTPFLLGIAGLVCLGSLLGMIVYIEMARLVGSTFPSTVARSSFFATRDLSINTGAFVLQLFVVGQVTRRLGVGVALIGSAIIVLLAFVTLGFDPTLPLLTAVSVALRCGEFGLAKPARDMHTVGTRGAEMASGWLHSLIGLAGVTLAGWGWIASGIALGLTAVAAGVGRGYRRRGGK